MDASVLRFSLLIFLFTILLFTDLSQISLFVCVFVCEMFHVMCDLTNLHLIMVYMGIFLKWSANVSFHDILILKYVYLTAFGLFAFISLVISCP